MAGRRLTVLCIENEAECLRHKAVFQRHGFDVIPATSAEDVFRTVKEKAVDAIVLDVKKIESVALAKQIKTNYRHIPLVLRMPASSEIPNSEFRAADALILKTDPPSILLTVVDALLDIEFPFFMRWFGGWKNRIGA